MEHEQKQYIIVDRFTDEVLVDAELLTWDGFDSIVLQGTCREFNYIKTVNLENMNKNAIFSTLESAKNVVQKLEESFSKNGIPKEEIIFDISEIETKIFKYTRLVNE